MKNILPVSATLAMVLGALSLPAAGQTSSGGAPAAASQMGIHWHVAGKVEYVATDPDRQNIPWVRAVDPLTGES